MNPSGPAVGDPGRALPERSSTDPEPRQAAPVRAGLIGFGYAGRTFHAPLLSRQPGLELVAVASRQTQAVRDRLGASVSVHAEAAELIARPDLHLVVIATPNDSHHPLARAALMSGKAVVIDKPMALDSRQAGELVDLARRLGQCLSVFHNRRWDGDFLTLRELIQGGQLGRLTQVELHFDRFRPQVRARWREAAGRGGGLWMDLAPHLLDQALQLFGMPLAIEADIAAQRDAAQADDCFRARLRYANGLRVTLSASTLAALPAHRFVVHGTLGSYRKPGLDTQEDALRAGRLPDPLHTAAWGIDPAVGELMVTDTAGGEPLASAVPTRPGRYPAYYQGLCDALRGLGPPPVTAGQALAVMQLLDLGRHSADAHQELTCPPDLENLLEL
jgi:predicted dehydrogenase